MYVVDCYKVVENNDFTTREHETTGVSVTAVLTSHRYCCNSLYSTWSARVTGRSPGEVGKMEDDTGNDVTVDVTYRCCLHVRHSVSATSLAAPHDDIVVWKRRKLVAVRLVTKLQAACMAAADAVKQSGY